jgi:hypothetical protein
MSKNAQLCVAKKNITTILLPMDNQSTSPQIIFPNVPDDFCPSGNWTEVFQQFIETVLANGTINVPGLGDVTPQEISTINQEIADQQNQIDAIQTQIGAKVTVRYGTIAGITTGDTASIGVTFSSEMPSAVYGVSLTPIYSTGTPTTTPLYSVITGSETDSGFTVRVDNNIASITSLSWMAVHTSQP